MNVPPPLPDPIQHGEAEHPALPTQQDDRDYLHQPPTPTGLTGGVLIAMTGTLLISAALIQGLQPLGTISRYGAATAMFTGAALLWAEGSLRHIHIHPALSAERALSALNLGFLITLIGTPAGVSVGIPLPQAAIGSGLIGLLLAGSLYASGIWNGRQLAGINWKAPLGQTELTRHFSRALRLSAPGAAHLSGAALLLSAAADHTNQDPLLASSLQVMAVWPALQAAGARLFDPRSSARGRRTRRALSIAALLGAASVLLHVTAGTSIGLLLSASFSASLIHLAWARPCEGMRPGAPLSPNQLNNLTHQPAELPAERRGLNAWYEERRDQNVQAELRRVTDQMNSETGSTNPAVMRRHARK